MNKEEKSSLDVVRSRAEKQGHALQGVWSAFGQPYNPLGMPILVSPNLFQSVTNGVTKCEQAHKGNQQ